MAYFEFPHTRTYDSDLGWLIRHTKQLIECCNDMTAWKAQHEEDYEELVNKVNGLINSLIEVIRPWDPGIEYQPFSIVEYQGQNYIAVQEVPVGAMITDTTYWQPANTVIEQINAIGVVVDNIQKMWNVVEDFDDLKETTTDRVIVLNDDGYYGSGCTVTYVKSPNAIPDHDNSAYQRTNGDWMMPEPSYDPVTPNAPMMQIAEVIGSYVNNTSIVSSQNNNDNPFRMDLPAGSMNGVDCSSFITFIMRGITYENSRYLASNSEMKLGQYVGNNIPRNIKSTRPGVPDLYMYKVGELGLFLAEQNRLYYIDYNKEHPVSQLAPGDLLFSCDDTIAPGRYMYAHHIAVVLEVFPESGRVLIAQGGGGGDKLSIRSSGTLYNAVNLALRDLADDTSGYLLYGRPDYNAGHGHTKSVIQEFRSRGQQTSPAAGGSATLAFITLSEPLKADSLYTVVLKGTLPDNVSDKAELRLRYIDKNNASIYQVITGVHEQGKVVFTVPAPENADDIKTIEVQAATPGSATDVTQHTLELTAADILIGCVPDAVPACESKDNFLTVTAAYAAAPTVNYACKTDKGVRLTVTFNVTTAQNADSLLGTFDDDYLPQMRSARYGIAYNNNSGAITAFRIPANTNEIHLGPVSTGYWNLIGIL